MRVYHDRGPSTLSGGFSGQCCTQSQQKPRPREAHALAQAGQVGAEFETSASGLPPRTVSFQKPPGKSARRKYEAR